jgi:putative transposase
VATRKRLRLARYDYGSPGAYFVTVCAARRGPVFGALEDATVVLQRAGEIVAAHISNGMGRMPGVSVPASTVMPDHVHVIVVLDAGAPSLSALVNSFKSASAREVSCRCARFAKPLWQRGFYDHVIRGEPTSTVSASTS